MSIQRCRGWLDYGKKKRCPVFDLTNCATPATPPNCPLKESAFRRPCYRYKCSYSTPDEVFNVTTTDFHVSYFILNIV